MTGDHPIFTEAFYLKSTFSLLIISIAAAVSMAQNTWVSSSVRNAPDLVAVYFTSSSRGFAAGDNGYLASTSDGGKSWQKYPLNTTENINEIYFRNDTHGYLVAGRLMFITQDGGQTWQETRIFRAADFRNGTPEFISIRFSDKNRGLVIGSVVNSKDEIVDSLLMRTEDGGDTWIRTPLPTKSEIFHLDLNGNSHGWIVGDKGLVMATTDGGRTWTTHTSGVTRALFAVDFRDDNDGFAVGGGGTIIRTEDGGLTWQKVPNSFSETLKRVNFADDKNGWAVGHHGTILRTIDKGRSWNRQESGVSSDLYGLFMAKKYGYAVGEGGTVLLMQK